MIPALRVDEKEKVLVTLSEAPTHGRGHEHVGPHPKTSGTLVLHPGRGLFCECSRV